MPPAPAWKMASATAASVPCAAGSPSASRLTLVRPLDDGRETEWTGQPLSVLSFREPLHRSYPRDLEHHDHREGVRRAGHQGEDARSERTGPLSSEGRPRGPLPVL